MKRQCGDCQLCCKLLPISAGSRRDHLTTQAELVARGLMAPDIEITPDFDKPAGQRCPHQRHHKGCNIYQRRPFGCRIWSCAWLTNDDTNDLPRPDRAHYVIDISPDFVRNNEQIVPVVQIWLDPDFPDAYRDPRLLAFIERRARQRKPFAALIRLDAGRAFLLLAPALSPDGQWHQIHSRVHEQEHTAIEKAAAIGDLFLTSAIERSR